MPTTKERPARARKQPVETTAARQEERDFAERKLIEERITEVSQTDVPGAVVVRSITIAEMESPDGGVTITYWAGQGEYPLPDWSFDTLLGAASSLHRGDLV